MVLLDFLEKKCKIEVKKKKFNAIMIIIIEYV